VPRSATLCRRRSSSPAHNQLTWSRRTA
jgi:hypothetical protein